MVLLVAGLERMHHLLRRKRVDRARQRRDLIGIDAGGVIRQPHADGGGAAGGHVAKLNWNSCGSFGYCRFRLWLGVTWVALTKMGLPLVSLPLPLA